MRIQNSIHKSKKGTLAKSSGQSETNADRAFKILREDIVSGKLRPNERLVESLIAKWLGMSRTPVREALARLVLSGYVSTLSKGGWIVTDHLPSQMRNLYEVREALEIMAIKLACLRATTEQIDRAKAVHRLIVDAVRNRDIDKFTQLNSEFHAYLFEACENEQLLSLIRNLMDQYFDRRVVYLFTGKEWNAMITQHEQMLEAVCEKKLGLAERAVRDHINTVKRVALLRL
jgi:DNA-binding GntR family transcriptional regulator